MANNIRNFRNRKIQNLDEHRLAKPMKSTKEPKRSVLGAEIEAFLVECERTYATRFNALHQAFIGAIDKILNIPELSQVPFQIDFLTFSNFISDSVEGELCGNALESSYPILIGFDGDCVYAIQAMEQKAPTDTTNIIVGCTKSTPNGALYYLSLTPCKWMPINDWMNDEILDVTQQSPSAMDLVQTALCEFTPETMNYVTSDHVINTLNHYKALIELVDNYDGMFSYEIFQGQILAVPSENNKGFAIRQNEEGTYDICLYLNDYTNFVFYPTIKGLYFDELHPFVREYIDRFVGTGLFTFPFAKDTIIQTKDIESFDEILGKNAKTALGKEIRAFLMPPIEGRD